MIRNDVSWADYLGIKRMNPSTLKAGLPKKGGMRNLRKMLLEGFGEPTGPMRLGSGVHVLTMEPELFEERFVIIPDFANDEQNLTKKGDRSYTSGTTYCQQKIKEFKESNAGKEFLTKKQYYDALQCIESIHECKEAREILEASGENREVTIEGIIDGVASKGRLDLFPSGEVSDIKTMGAASIDHDSVRRAVLNLDYLFSLGFYRDLARQHGHDPKVSVIAVQVGGCFDCAVYDVPSQYIDWGFDRVVEVMRDYKAAKEMDFWPGVDRGLGRMTLNIPMKWLQGEEANAGTELDWEDSEEAEAAF